MGLFKSLEKFGEQPALMDTAGESLSFRELVSLSDEFVSGINGRQLVFCLCSNSVPSIVGYVGFIRNNHVCVMLPSSIERGRLQNLEDLFQPNLIFAPTEALRRRDLVVIGEIEEYGLAKLSSTNVDMHSDLSMLMTTSGSTGNPMLVRISSSNLVSNAESIIESLELHSVDRALTTLPMNYTYGLSIINSQLQNGGSLVVSDATLMDRQFWNAVSSSGATYFGGVPYTYHMLQRIGIHKLKGSSIRMLTQAGGKLEEEAVKQIHSQCSEVGIEFNVMYGQTEATARMSVLKSNVVAEHPWSIGKAIPGGKLTVVDSDTGLEVKPGTIGELEFTGPNVAMGYATSRGDLLRDSDFGGSIRTGDLAILEPDGFLRIVGRLKRFVKIFGNRVNLDDVEQMVLGTGILAACTGRDDKITVHVVSDQDFDRALLQDLVSKFIGAHKNSVGVRMISEIPRAESGKVLYSELIGD